MKTSAVKSMGRHRSTKPRMRDSGDALGRGRMRAAVGARGEEA
jgi:hypothetical protein